MPIGKQSINRVAKKADTEEIKPVVEQQTTKAKKPSATKKSTTGAARTKSVKLTPPEVDHTKEESVGGDVMPQATKAPMVGGDVKGAPIQATKAPTVTEHVIANIDPVVIEKVVGKETPAPKDGKVKLTDPMPSYLL